MQLLVALQGESVDLIVTDWFGYQKEMKEKFRIRSTFDVSRRSDSI